MTRRYGVLKNLQSAKRREVRLKETNWPRPTSARGLRPEAEPSRPVVSRLSTDEAIQLRDLQSVTRRVGRINFVTSDVKQFVSDFSEGARDPTHYIAQQSLISREFADLWLRTPVEKRIFLIGAGKDAEMIKAVQAQFNRDGYTVFFYQTCVTVYGRLCDSAVVGAFFGSSGKAFLVDSLAAEASRYVPLVIAAAQRQPRGIQLFALAGYAGRDNCGFRATSNSASWGSNFGTNPTRTWSRVHLPEAGFRTALCVATLLIYCFVQGGLPVECGG